jgi:hypothetical protein
MPAQRGISVYVGAPFAPIAVSNYHAGSTDVARGGSSKSAYPWPSMYPSATMGDPFRLHWRPKYSTHAGSANWFANVIPGAGTRGSDLRAADYNTLSIPKRGSAQSFF